VAQSNRKQVEALSEISDIIVQISDDDLERMELLAQQVTRFDREVGSRILEVHALLIQLDEDVETALERLDPGIEEDEYIEEDEDVDQNLMYDDKIDDEDAMDDEDEEEADGPRGRTQSKRRE